MTKIPETKIISELQNLKDMKGIYALSGNYRGYRRASKQFAKAGLNNFEVVKTLPSNIKISVPLFSKQGLKMARILLLQTFAKKTPEEKLFNSKTQLERLIKQETNNHTSFLSAPAPVDESAIKKFTNWKNTLISIEKTKKAIAKLEKRIK